MVLQSPVFGLRVCLFGVHVTWAREPLNWNSGNRRPQGPYGYYHLLKGPQKINNNYPYSTLIRDYFIFFLGGGALKQFVGYVASWPLKLQATLKLNKHIIFNNPSDFNYNNIVLRKPLIINLKPKEPLHPKPITLQPGGPQRTSLRGVTGPRNHLGPAGGCCTKTRAENAGIGFRVYRLWFRA